MPRADTASDYNLTDILRQAGFTGQALQTAYGIMMAESGGNLRAHNTNAATGDNSYGLFQINMLGAMGPERMRTYGLSSYDDLFDPLTNAKAAYRMSKGGTDWSPWSTYKSGAYRNYAHVNDNATATVGDSITTKPYYMNTGHFAQDPLAPLVQTPPDFAPEIKDFAPGSGSSFTQPAAPSMPATASRSDTRTAWTGGTSGGSSFRDKVISAAMAELGVDYSWGGGSKTGATYGIQQGANIKGFDCSGLMLYAFAQAGYNLPRLSYDQLKQGQRVDVSQLQPGDFVGFRDGGHIALYIGNGQILEAPHTGAQVRVRKLGSNENAWGVHLNLPGDN